MNFRNLILPVFALLFSAITAFANEVEITTLVVTPEGESPLYLCFQHRPAVTFTEQNIVISTENQSLSFPLTTKVDFSFSSEGPAGVDNIKTDNIMVRLFDNSIDITGLPGDIVLTVYNISGTVIYSCRTDEKGAATINISNYTPGIYILNSKYLSYKFILK